MRSRSLLHVLSSSSGEEDAKLCLTRSSSC